MFVQKAEQIDDRRQRNRLTPFIAREGIGAAAGQTRGRDLGQAELTADAVNFLTLPLPVAQWSAPLE
jgi:hypothetical protein